MSDWNFMSRDSQENLLEVLRHQAGAFFTMAADGDRCEAPTGAGTTLGGAVVVDRFCNLFFRI